MKVCVVSEEVAALAAPGNSSIHRVPLEALAPHNSTNYCEATSITLPAIAIVSQKQKQANCNCHGRCFAPRAPVRNSHTWPLHKGHVLRCSFWCCIHGMAYAGGRSCATTEQKISHSGLLHPSKRRRSHVRPRLSFNLFNRFGKALPRFCF